MGNGRLPLAVRGLGAGIVALGLALLARALLWRAGLAQDFPAKLTAVVALVPLVGGLWLFQAERFLGRRAPAFDWNAFWGGNLSLAAGVFLMAVSAWDPRNEAFHGPRWIVAAAGLVFVLGGIGALRRGNRTEREGGDLTSLLLMLTMMTCFGLLCTWVAFGPGEREFEGGLSLPFFSMPLGTGEIQGRVAFGIAAVLLDLVALATWGAAAAGLWKWWRRRGRKSADR